MRLKHEEVPMRSLTDDYCLCSVYYEPLSLESLAVPYGDEAALEYPIEDPSADVEALIERVFDFGLIRDFVLGLKPREQQLLYRLFWSEDTQADIARDMKISGAAVCKAVKRIIEQGRVALAPLRQSAFLQ
jgi:DNA-directed RNA polymerase specialized sigma subunit